MPISSYQVSGMISGQQAMFGNFSSYAQQISPGGSYGSTPTYSNPMMGMGIMPTSPIADPFSEGKGPEVISAIGNIGLPALSSAAMIGGSFLPGMLGRTIGSLDPFTAGLRGFAGGAGLRSGGMGIMSNMGRIASGGAGSIARAGFAGLGGAAIGAALPLAAGFAAQYGIGQMVQGAQFNNQTENFLQNQFRFVNPMAETGFGFGRQQSGQISDTIREMGSKEFYSSPQELLKVMQAGTGMGVFRAVQDVRAFKQRFTEMVSALKEISSTMNTSLEGALPFFQQSRQMGFWTPQDITRHAQMARQTASATGMTVAQTQQMMVQGAQMARQIGAPGATGATGMSHAMELVGGAIRSGSISEQRLSEVTGGLMGNEAIQSMAGTLQTATTNFARSNIGRFLLASMGRNGFKNLDTAALQRFTSGGMSLGEISGSARGNIGKQGAANFLMNEEELRGQLLELGPGAQGGFIQSVIGKRLFSENSRDKYVTRRMIKRFAHLRTSQEADMFAQLIRDAPSIMEESQSRYAASHDQELRNRDQTLDHSLVGLKRKVSKWMDQTVGQPLAKLGSAISRDIEELIEHTGNKIFGISPAINRLRGINAGAMRALQNAALGDTRLMEYQFGKPGDFEKSMGSTGTGLGTVGGGLGGFFAGKGLIGGLGNFLNPTGAEFSNRRIDALKRMGVPEASFENRETQERVNRQQGLISGRTTEREIYGFKSMSVADIISAQSGLEMAMGHGMTAQGAAALGYSSIKEAEKSLALGRKDVESVDYLNKAADMAMGASGRDLGEKMVREIEKGQFKGTYLASALSGNLSMQQKVNRLAAFQSKERRESTRGGINLSGEVEALGGSAFANVERTEGTITERTNKVTDSLIGFLRSPPIVDSFGGLFETSLASMGGLDDFGIGPPLESISADAIQSLQKRPEFKELTLAIALDATTKEEKSARQLKIDRAVVRLKQSDISRDEHEAIKAMMDKSHPNHKGIQGQLKNQGLIERDRQTAAVQETLVRRSTQFLEGLSSNKKDALFRALDKAKGGGDRSLGDIVRDLTKTTLTPAELVSKMKELVTSAGQADPKDAAEALKIASSIPGLEHVSVAISGAMSVAQLTKRLTGDKLRDSGSLAQALNQASGGTLQLSGGQLKVLRGKDEVAAGKLKDELVKSIEDEGVKDNTLKILTAIRKKDETTLHNALDNRTVLRALGQLTSPELSILNDSKVKGMTFQEMAATYGTPRGMHRELLRIAVAVESIDSKKKSKFISADPFTEDTGKERSMKPGE